MTLGNRKREKKLAQGAKAFKVCLGKILEKITKGVVGIFVGKTAVDVVGNAKEGFGTAGVDRSGKSRIAPNATAQRGAKGRVVDVFVLLMIRHRKIPLDNDLLSAYAEEERAVKGCMGGDSILLL